MSNKTSYSFRPRKKEHPYIIRWLEKQTNYNDAIRFLIEQDIKENGVRDLSQCIPSVRNFSLTPYKDNNENKEEQKQEQEQKVENITEDFDIPSCYE